MQHYEKKELTAKEISILMQSPFVTNVINQRVMYTEEFRKQALEEKMKGKTAREILISHGIDPDILGPGRVQSMNSNLNTTLRLINEQDSEDKAIINKNKEIDRLNEEIKKLRNRVNELESANQQLFNLAGYYEAENRAIKKK